MDTVQIKKSNYENIIVECPYCRKELIFNRISDLKSIAPIMGRELSCDVCDGSFWAIGDRIQSAKYEWFLDELDELKNNKRYGLYILTLCQACEVFMHQAIINKMIDKNPQYRHADEGFFYFDGKGTNIYGELYGQFCKKTIREIANHTVNENTEYSKATFDSLRKLFFHLFKNNEETSNPLDKERLRDSRITDFYELEKTDINTARNNTIHKNGYRPSFSEIEKYDPLITCLERLGAYLEVKDSWYYLKERICQL